MRTKDGTGGYTLRFVFLVALGFLVLFAVLMGFLGYRPGATPAPEPTTRSVQILAPRGDLPEIPREFVWAPEQGAGSYRVRIADDDAIWPLFVRTTEATRVDLTDKEAGALTPGRIHLWEVEALDARGVIVASGGARFRVVPPGGG